MIQEPSTRTASIGPGAARYAAATFCIAVAGWFFYESLPFLPPTPGSNDVGPGAVPAIASFLLAACAVTLSAWRDPTPNAAEVEEPLRVVGALVLLLAFVLGLSSSSLNAWVVIGSFILSLQLTLGERRWSYLLIGTALLLAAIWLMFGRVLGVPL